MNKEILAEYKKSHDNIHRSVGRTEEYIQNAADWNKETFQISEFLKVLETLPAKPSMIELGTSMFPTYSKIFTEVRTDSLETANAILPDSKYNVLIQGSMRIGDQYLVSGEMFIIEPGETVKPHFIEDCIVVTVKVPSVIGDKYVVH